MKPGETVASLIRVGFFREFARDEGEQRRWPSIQDWLADSPHPDEELIVQYLQNGACLAARGGMVSDVLSPHSPPTLYAHTLTDGVYLWRADLAYYVSTYHVRLPEEFTQHMARLRWTPPAEGDLDWGALLDGPVARD